jgi:hypothetical protein
MAALSIVSALQALKTAGDMVKTLRAVDGAFDKAELKLKIATLAESLADAKMSVLDAQTELEEMRQRVAQLEAAQDSRDQLVKRQNVYWFAEGDTEQGPFCPRCFEVKHVRMPVTKLPPAMQRLAHYRCPECDATY